MVIIGGIFEVDPQLRDEFVAGRLDMMRASRAEPGCLEYTFSADPIEPGRVVLFERWTDQQALDVHLAAQRAGAAQAGSGVVPRSATITCYDVSGERPLGR